MKRVPVVVGVVTKLGAVEQTPDPVVVIGGVGSPLTPPPGPTEGSPVITAPVNVVYWNVVGLITLEISNVLPL